MQNTDAEEKKSGFGFWTVWSVVLASMVGTGILTTSGPVLKTTQSFGALFALWVAGGLVALAGALTMAELASAIPQAGGDYVFVRRAFGEPVGFVYGWAMVVVGFAAPTALAAYTTGAYLQPLVAGVFGPASAAWIDKLPIVIASILIILFTLIHCSGHRGSAWAQNLATFFNAGLLAAFAFFIFAAPQATLAPMVAHFGLAEWNLSALGNGLMIVMYAYTGWNGAVYIAGETRRAARTIPFSLTVGCITVAVLYLLVNVAYGMAVSLETVNLLSEAELSRLADVAGRQVLGATTSRVFSLLISFGVVSAVSAYLMTGPRILFAMARDGLFLNPVGKLHPTREVPALAILFQGVMALGFLWSGTFEQVLQYCGFGLAVVGVLSILPIFVLRKDPSYKPLVRTPLFPFPPLFFFAVTCWMLYGGFVESLATSLLSLGTILIGFPIFFFARKVGWLRCVSSPAHC